MDSFIIFSSKYIIYIVGLIAVFVTLRSERAVRNRLIMLAVLSLLVAFGIASLGGLLYFDPRPFTVTHTTPLIPHLPDDGFPSDHTLYAMAAAATVFCYWRKTGILLGVPVADSAGEGNGTRRLMGQGWSEAELVTLLKSRFRFHVVAARLAITPVAEQIKGGNISGQPKPENSAQEQGNHCGIVEDLANAINREFALHLALAQK